MSDARFTPVAVNERITTLDVIRGVALLGIFLMNIEWFNRPISELDVGLPQGVTGIDYWAGWFVHVFIRSKFWTMFSLLFGMGFAVMLSRAHAAGRPFLGPYVRRTLALALFGFLHAVLVWNGDILFDYAMGAAFLLIVFHAKPKAMLWVAGVALLGAAVFGGAKLAGYDQVVWAPLLGIGVPVLTLGLVAWAIRKWPANGLRNAGLTLFLLPCMGMMIGGLVTPQTTQVERDRIALKDAHTPAEKAQVRKDLAEAAKARKEHADKVAEETRITSRGTYAENVAFRLQEFPQTAGQHVFFALFFVLGMFLLGAWFIRSGLMTQPGMHLDLYRKLAMFGIPFGIGLTIVAAAIATTHVKGVNDALYTFSMGLGMVAALPACLGYVAAIVLLFHSPRFTRFMALFAPAGRMALTVYLTMSVIGTTVFYGYGLGWYGMGRAMQLVFCVVVFAVLLAACHLWLSRFRYGPMEWVWRAITYLRAPSMRLERLQPA
ncbi:DUF418 domain-containing protein [Lysobacter sp. KIS68-7]|uniref:DUF418 domain-containing protein n=1 Tax=Lysobacter sp. KIS68-7 TaxID=2904252 RepID=UPI001E2BD37E|nr:DUF418 domain-containing protein [Lysobacter sp. KIS68-7]UHQ18229.1 DUF418 domain-containing protein [Lysobacter sp. KIS68-7]